MQKKLSTAKQRKQVKRDDTAIILSQLFNCDDSYIRRVVKDTKHQIHKGEKTMNIRKAYLEYKHSKQAIIAELQKYKPQVSNEKTAA